MSRIIATIQLHDIVENDDLSVEYTSKADVDADGSGPNIYHDKFYQPATSLKVNGESLNALTERYTVVPPAILKGVKGIVLGCLAIVSYKGKSVTAVVADEGPPNKLGEYSIALCAALGIPRSPVNGGVPSGVHTKLFPGRAAVVDGKTYPLQKS